MTAYGHIRWFNDRNGAGTIMPEDGGDALPFRAAEMPEQSPRPQVDQRYSYETLDTDSGRKRAVNLRRHEECEEEVLRVAQRNG